MQGSTMPGASFGGWQTILTGILISVLRIPWEVMSAGMGTFMPMMQQTPSPPTGACAQSRHSAASAASAAGQSEKTEAKIMPDQDLGGDDLKYVSYSILFTKPDLEAVLQPERQELVSYSTDVAVFGGDQISTFLIAASQGEVERPQIWKENHYPYNQGDFHWNIPKEDKRYLRFIYRIEDRLAKESPDYEKQQAESLRQISAKIG